MKQRNGKTARGDHRYYCEVMLEAGAGIANKTINGKTAIDFVCAAISVNSRKLADAQGNLEAANSDVVIASWDAGGRPIEDGRGKAAWNQTLFRAEGAYG
ncbi:Uu.00g027750.m01.CDS01 [Anthostomella pinea]|uniref:Uu.00g027750.m01.CDS01 n=1 Tax=Anthostomella pinea TaxID=933095 RepID=A0AAI8YCR0_9PEZI|nr:Uu.00g027750.m01.CDS01 [Anthostomella pinea]